MVDACCKVTTLALKGIITDTKPTNQIDNMKHESAVSPVCLVVPKTDGQFLDDAIAPSNVADMLNTSSTDGPYVRSHSLVELVTTSSSPIIFTSPLLQPKSRKRELVDDAEGPSNPKILRATSTELTDDLVRTRDAATSPVTFSNDSNHSDNLDPSSPGSKFEEGCQIPTNGLDFSQNDAIHDALTPPQSPSNISLHSDSDGCFQQQESDVDEKEVINTSSCNSRSPSPQSLASSRSSSYHGSVGGRSRSRSRSRTRTRSSRSRTRSRGSSVSSVRSQSSGSWTSRTLSESTRSSLNHESEQSASPRSESRSGSEISEHTFRSGTRSDEYSQDERGFSVDSISDDEEEPDHYFLVGPFNHRHILEEAQQILSVYSPPIEE